ncbi:hypothetical protein V1477_017685 [Vespula maculifrons]|uniref:Uncharacterized protein n=1 Tax=Vespula maculifrons TaxID=7453 RepID=A0ABD2B6Q8_VESMC
MGISRETSGSNSEIKSSDYRKIVRAIVANGVLSSSLDDYEDSGFSEGYTTTFQSQWSKACNLLPKVQSSPTHLLCRCRGKERTARTQGFIVTAPCVVVEYFC